MANSFFQNHSKILHPKASQIQEQRNQLIETAQHTLACLRKDIENREQKLNAVLTSLGELQEAYNHSMLCYARTKSPENKLKMEDLKEKTDRYFKHFEEKNPIKFILSLKSTYNKLQADLLRKMTSISRPNDSSEEHNPEYGI